MNQRSTTILLGLALAVGCKTGTVTENQADLYIIAPDGVTNVSIQKSTNLGDSCVGLPKDVTYTFTLSSNALVTVSPSAITTDNPEFTVVNPAKTAPAFNVPGDQVLTLQFTPTMTGSRSGSLTIGQTVDATNTPLTIALSGNGLNGYPVPAFDTSCPLPGAGPGTFPLTPCDSLSFLNVYFNTKQDIPVTLFNDGGCPPFIIDSATLVYDGGAFSDGGGPFAILGTFPQSVALATPPYNLVVEYSPKAPSGNATSTADDVQLVIHTTNGLYGDAGTKIVDVHGIGVAPLVSLDGPEGSGCNKFARQGDMNGFAYEREPITLTFTIVNGATNTPVVVGAAYLDAGNTGFTIVKNSCWTDAGVGGVLPDGGISLPTKNSSATCDITFDPVNSTSDGGLYPTNGAFFDYLEAPYIALEPDGGQAGVAVVCLHATAEPQVCVAPISPISLPTVTYCGFFPQDIQTRNCGSVDLIVNDIFLDFQTISSWTLFKGSSFPTTLQWSDPPITSTVLYSDDGGINNPSTRMLTSSNAAGAPDGGTSVIVNASAWGLNPPPDLLVPQYTNGGGRISAQSVGTQQVDMPATGGPTPYNMNWYYMLDGVVLDAGELVTDGGYHAWLTPAQMGVYSVCANVVEAPLPDGGANCNASVDGGGNCTSPKLTVF